MVLLTKSNISGSDRSPVPFTIRRDCQDGIKSRCSALFYSDIIKLTHSEDIQCPKCNWCRLLDTTFQKNIELGLLSKVFCAATPKILPIAFHQSVWSTRRRKECHPTPHSRNKCANNNQIAARVTIIAINDRNSHPIEFIPLPCPHKDQHARAPILKIGTRLPMRPHPIDETCHDTRIYPIQDDARKWKSTRNFEFWPNNSQKSGDNTALTRSSPRDQPTVRISRLAVNRNCSRSHCRSSQLPPNWRTTTKEDIYANIGTWGSTFPEASGIRFSGNGYSWSWTTRGARRIFWRCFSSSASGKG